MSRMHVTWIDYITGEVTAFRKRGQTLDPRTPIVTYLYAHPDGEADLRAVLADLTGEVHGYLSPLCPPGELRVSLDPIDDDQAREVTA